jgi:hypothetical protein
MTNKSTGISDSKMIERILDTQETILEKQSDMGEQLAKMPGLWEGSMRSMLAEHEKACEKKGVSIFRLQAPFIFNVASIVALMSALFMGYKAFNAHSIDIESLKNNHKTEQVSDINT